MLLLPHYGLSVGFAPLTFLEEPNKLDHWTSGFFDKCKLGIALHARTRAIIDASLGTIPGVETMF